MFAPQDTDVPENRTSATCELADKKKQSILEYKSECYLLSSALVLVS